MVFGVLPEKQMIDAKLTSGRYLVPGDGYKAVIGSSIARKFNLKVGDELEMKSKRLQRTSSITNTRNVSVVGILEYTGSFLIIRFRSLLTMHKNSIKWKTQFHLFMLNPLLVSILLNLPEDRSECRKVKSTSPEELERDRRKSYDLRFDNDKCGSACSDHRRFECHEYDANVSL